MKIPKPILIRCSMCGAPLHPEGDKAVCKYCGMVHLFRAEAPAPSGDELARQGIEYHQSEDYNRSIQAFEEAIQKGITRYPLTDIYTIMGHNYMEMGLQEKAQPWYRKSLELDGRYYKAWVGLGISYRKQGDQAEAERCYLAALELAPNYAELHASLGALYIFQGKSEQAVRALEKAVQLDSSVAIAHGNLSLAYAMTGRFDEAEASLRQAVALGYKNHKAIRQRIDNLKSMEE